MLHLAAQAPRKWTTESATLTVKKHFYRAVLQVLFVRHELDPVVGKFRKNVYQQPFEHYVQAVVQRHRLPEVLITHADIKEYDDKNVIAAVCLRAMCAAIVESLIVVDRWMALREQNSYGSVGLHRVFDAQISPRGWAIVASRN